jgi:hypothetical protein
VVAKFGERPTVNKQGLHVLHMERFSLKRLKEVKEAALEDFGVEVEINGTWKMIRENLKILSQRYSS